MKNHRYSAELHDLSFWRSNFRQVEIKACRKGSVKQLLCCSSKDGAVVVVVEVAFVAPPAFSRTHRFLVRARMH